MISRRLFMGLAAALPFVGKGAAAEPNPTGSANVAKGYRTGIDASSIGSTTGSGNTFIGPQRAAIFVNGQNYGINIYDLKG